MSFTPSYTGVATIDGSWVISFALVRSSERAVRPVQVLTLLTLSFAPEAYGVALARIAMVPPFWFRVSPRKFLIRSVPPSVLLSVLPAPAVMSPGIEKVVAFAVAMVWVEPARVMPWLAAIVPVAAVVVVRSV